MADDKQTLWMKQVYLNRRIARADFEGDTDAKAQFQAELATVVTAYEVAPPEG